VIIPIPSQIGFLMIAGVAAFAAVTYTLGRRTMARGEDPMVNRRRVVDLLPKTMRLPRLPLPKPKPKSPPPASDEPDPPPTGWGGTPI
jgi:hypothetical protein